MKVVSYVDKFVFQVFREIFAGKKKMNAFTTLLFLTAFCFLVSSIKCSSYFTLIFYTYRPKKIANLYVCLCCVRLQVNYFSLVHTL